MIIGYKAVTPSCNSKTPYLRSRFLIWRTANILQQSFDNFEINCSFDNSRSFEAINPFLPTYLGYKSFVKAKSLLLHHINRCSIFYHSNWRASFLPYFNFFSKYGCRFGCMLIYFGFSCPNSFDSLSGFLQCL